ncbi:hypothetical protein [Lysinibacillus sp. LZ02]|uniref:hypothetical protein n=1 Tax=Lysinibacillus sp. LZ02 TaxID=3420668 RepID=UPI003D3631CB
MQTFLKKGLVSIMTLILVLSTFANFTSAQVIDVEESYEPTEEEINELAQQLEDLHKNGFIFDENGVVIDYNFTYLEETFGLSKEELLPTQQVDEKLIVCESLSTYAIVNNPNKDKINQCINEKIKENFGEVFAVATISTILGLIWDGLYTEAASKMLKFLAKGNAISIAGQLIWWHGTCVKKYNGWI